ncbi:MAG TPA: DUF6166 domain-containing protein [Terriglobales bacterium]|nr:DUF6166 domain-containing protein [Terriglobales bacterium]
MEKAEGSSDPQELLETLSSWQGAPRKRMAKLCWQLLVKNNSTKYFDQHFTYDLHWLERQASDCGRTLLPIQKKLRWVMEGFRERRQEDHLIGQGNWGEDWFLPAEQAAYVRKEVRRSRPDLVEESSNYEDALRYFMLPYFEVVCDDRSRTYIGKHHESGGAYVWIKDGSGQQYPLSHTSFPFDQKPGTGFSWGYFGSGPSALSLSILADSLAGDLEITKNLQVPFIEEVLAKTHWDGDFRLSHKKVLKWLDTKNIRQEQLAAAERRVNKLKMVHEKDLIEQKRRMNQIQSIGGLRMQRFDIVPSDFESALYVDLMHMFERSGWVLHCSRCEQPIACERSPRGNRQRARWLTGRPIYHDSCFKEHRLNRKRVYWEERNKEPEFRALERRRARERRKHSSKIIA